MTKNTTERVEIYTDGACSGNPGPGGWGALLRYRGVEKTISGALLETTNNQMELMAAIEALKALSHPSAVVLYTDSKYVQQGMTLWIQGWQKKGWKNSAGHPVKNQALWQALQIAAENHDIEWCWVKGHSDHPENDRVDALARKAIDTLLGHERSMKGSS